MLNVQKIVDRARVKPQEGKNNRVKTTGHVRAFPQAGLVQKKKQTKKYGRGPIRRRLLDVC